MNPILKNIKPEIHDRIFLKDPVSSELGKNILKMGILLIDEIGFEAFTFKKLGERLNTNESSVYRYFDNKHKFLLYISTCYWSWIEYLLVLETTNLEDPKERLKKTISLVTTPNMDKLSLDYIDFSILYKIIISEFTKTFLTKEVDDENHEGFFKIYKRVIYRIADTIKEVNPNYCYPETLASNMVEGALHQHFLKEHFKTITNCNDSISPTDFYVSMVTTILNNSI
ncbi:MAG: helix-turn-helix transcriptional regulator [Bacteroidetes bacterium]|nr:helix-turn-helix transcriptional regulator [Bacteroidota bacterium]